MFYVGTRIYNLFSKPFYRKRSEVKGFKKGYLVQLTFMGYSLGFILVFIFLLVSLLTAGHFYVSGLID